MAHFNPGWEYGDIVNYDVNKNQITREDKAYV